MFSHPKHLALAPIYWYQAKRIQQTTLRLPEPDGDRQGRIDLQATNEQDSLRQSDELKQSDASYRLMIVGDSSAAGVGVENQQQALSHQLLAELKNHLSEPSKQSNPSNLSNSSSPSKTYNYHQIEWQLHATTGHNSFDVLRRLYVLPPSEQALDLLIIVVGVNDVTAMRPLHIWKSNLSEIVQIARHKFQPKQIIFTAIPPLEIFPALPYPLNGFISDKEKQLNHAMQAFCESLDNVNFANFNLLIGESNQVQDYFAKDGFHPSALTYKLWAEQLAESVLKD